MLRKAKLYSLLLIIVASTAISLFGLPQTARAQSSDEVDSVLMEQARETSYQKLFYQCLLRWEIERVGLSPQTPAGVEFIAKGNDLIGSGHNTTAINTDTNNDTYDPKSGGGKNRTGWLAGYLVDTEDGVMSCKGGDGDKLIAEYKKTSGYSTPPEYSGNGLENFHFLCTVGFRPVNDEKQPRSDMSVEDCVENARAGNAQAPYKVSRSLVEANIENPGFGPAQQYLAYRYTLLNVCQAVPPSATQQSSDVTMVNMDGEPETVAYYLPYPNRTVPVFVGSQAKCSDIPGLMNGDPAAAYIAYREDPANADNEAVTDEDDLEGVNENSTCQIDGIGWLICPVMNFLAGIVDDSYELLDKSLLRTAPIKVGDSSDPLFQSWQVMRNFANILFIIGFLYIVYSQITSFGISNYGVKRLLPKLIIAAILVNISYYICAIAVDISNIVGSSLKDLLTNTVGDSIVPSAPSEPWDIPLAPDVNDPSGSSSGAVGWKGIVFLALAGSVLAGGPLALIAFLIPLLFAALSAVLLTVVVLILRQVLIILLVVIAPLAFIALLLPNTEDYFKKWRSTFQTLLLLYPVIALIFGASALASKIISASADNYDDGAKIFIQLTGAAAAVIPLFITPLMMKLGGGVLNRFAGIVNDPSKGLIDRSRNAATSRVDQGQKRYAAGALEGKWRPGGAKIKRDARRKERDKNTDSELALATATFNAQEAVAAGSKDGASASTLRRASRAQSTLNKLDNQEVEDAAILMRAEERDPAKLLEHAAEQLEKANTAGDSVRARAAAKILTAGGAQGNKLLDTTIQTMLTAPGSNGKLHENVDTDLRSDLVGSKSVNNARERWALGSGNDIESNYTRETVEMLSAQELATQKDYVLQKYEDNNAITPEVAQNVLDQAKGGAFSLTEKNTTRFKNIANRGRGGPAPATPGGGTPPTTGGPTSPATGGGPTTPRARQAPPVATPRTIPTTPPTTTTPTAPPSTTGPTPTTTPPATGGGPTTPRARQAPPVATPRTIPTTPTAPPSTTGPTPTGGPTSPIPGTRPDDV